MSCHVWCIGMTINTLRPRQNGRHFAEDTFKRIFLNQNVINLIKISPKFVPKGRIHNIPSLVQIMAWRQPGDKPLSEPMMVRLTTHICVTRPQWIKSKYKLTLLVLEMEYSTFGGQYHAYSCLGSQSRQSISRHVIGCVGQTTYIVILS